MQRRHLLKATATTALAALAPRAFAQGTVMDRLSAYMAGARTNALSDAAAEQAKHHLIDTLAAMVSGSRLGPGEAAQRYIKMHGAQGTATIVGTALTAAVNDAALANGVMAHADETDDSHNASRSHPGCAVVPAALALAEARGIEGAHLLRAVALGYDIGPRIVMAMGGAEFSYENLLSTHSIAGTFGAAAAAACVAGHDARKMRFIIDYAAQQAAGYIVWRRDVDHIEKAFVFAGRPASAGMTCALVVDAGWTGIGDVFSGADNFFQAYAPKGKPEEIVAELGTRYEIVQTDIKKWTVGSPIQAPLDGIEAMRAKHPFESADVRTVRVRLAPSVAAVVDNRDIPDICLQHMVAVMLLDKTASFHAAHDVPRMKDAAVLHERAKVQLIRDEELAKLLPARVTVVEIELADGMRLSERVTAVRGTARNPMTRAEVIAKARDLTEPILGAEKARRLIETVYAIEAVKDVRELGVLLRA
jgi:2-methylcitrate dehydratase PrpD